MKNNIQRQAFTIMKYLFVGVFLLWANSGNGHNEGSVKTINSTNDEKLEEIEIKGKITDENGEGLAWCYCIVERN